VGVVWASSSSDRKEHAATQPDEGGHVTPEWSCAVTESSLRELSASDIQIRDGLLAEMTLLREKPRLGFGHAESTVHQGLKAANYLNHVRDTTTVVRYSWQMVVEGPTADS